MTILSSLSARMMSSDSRKAWHSGRFQELRFSGRLSVMRATPASASRSRMSSGHSLSVFHWSGMRFLHAGFAPYCAVFEAMSSVGQCPQRIGMRDFLGRIAYIWDMTKMKDRLSPEQVAAARERRLEAMHLQEIEGNPLDEQDIAMFEMFECEGWDHERRRAYILAQARATAAAK